MATAPVLEAAAEMKRIWGTKVRPVTVTVVRPIDNDPSKGWSQHSYGNAIDAYGTRAIMTAIAAWATYKPKGGQPRVVIWNKRIWTFDRKRWETYTGKNPHTDHVHLDYRPRWTGTPPGHPVGAAAEIARQYPTPAPVSQPYGGGWLTPIQTQLIGLGRLSRTQRGISLSETAAAITAWNRQRGTGTTSQVGKRTWESWDNFSLKQGSSGRLTTGAQLFLLQYGFLRSTQVDGKFGPVTSQAVTRFQAKAKLQLTGRITANDWRALWFGPAAWDEEEVGAIHDPDWRRPAEGSPEGRLDHSWEHTLRGLDPHAKRTVGLSGSYSRGIRSRV